MPADFEKQSYWHERFTNETSFEWLVPSSTFMSLLEPHLCKLNPSSSKILHIGFGTSDLQTHLRARGFTNVLNIDFEPLAIAHGRMLEKQLFGDVRMRYEVVDVTATAGAGGLSELGRGFDLVVDKSTVDAVSCGGEEGLLRMVGGVRGCLEKKKGRDGDGYGDGDGDGGRGVWVSLSYSSSRFALLEGTEGLFEVDVEAKIPTVKRKGTDPDVFYWCYVLRPKD